MNTRPTMFPSSSAAYIAELGDAAQAIVIARDFCGDEAEALRDWESDNRRLTEPERGIARDHAERIWRASQRAAGVAKPITTNERISINRKLADD